MPTPLTKEQAYRNIHPTYHPIFERILKSFIQWLLIYPSPAGEHSVSPC
jgi:hypothetical protein